MQRFRKISSLLLSLLVLLSSTSFTFNMHYCLGQMQSIALFQEANRCGMDDIDPVCSVNDPAHDAQHFKGKSCCEDHTLLIEAQDELAPGPSVSLPDYQLATVLFVVMPFIFSTFEEARYSYTDYTPPLIDRDIPVLVQSFLI